MNETVPLPAGTPLTAHLAVPSTTPDPMAFASLLMAGDAVSRLLLALLMGMSLVSWGLIALKTASGLARARQARTFLRDFWSAGSLDAARESLERQTQAEPFSELAAHALAAARHADEPSGPRLADTGGREALLTRTLRQTLEQASSRLENGLTALATIGATAPFVGLFGTVWGIHHALRRIGAQGGGSLDQVAGPVGEALVMTAIGLAVAMPALVAYNAFTRRNRVLEARLDAFAFELLNLLTTGRPLQPPGLRP